MIHPHEERRFTIVPPSIMCLLLLTLVSANSRGDDVSKNRRTIVTFQPTSMLVCENETLRLQRRLPQCTVFESVVVNPLPSCISDHYWCVQGLDAEIGFVTKSHTFDLTEMRTRVLSALEGESNPSIPLGDESVPRVVRVSDPRIVDAWNDLASIYEWNKDRPQDKRCPEPFIARAQIWTAVGNHRDALTNFLEAASLVREQQTGDFLEYAHYFTVLESALSREETLPGTPHVAEAKSYWGRGMVHIRSGRLDEAALNFTDAVRLNPTDPLYWYCRALAFKKLGLDERAERDARIGVTAEQRIGERRGRYDTSSIYRSLEPLQGPERAWLKKLRDGDGIAWKRYR